MKNLILMALDKAKRLSPNELAKEIAQLERGERKLYLRDERGWRVPLHPIVFAVFREVQKQRKKWPLRSLVWTCVGRSYGSRDWSS